MTRLDAYLVENGFVDSREQAKQAVLNGRVSVDGGMATNPSQKVKPGAKVVVREPAELPAGYHRLTSIQEQHPLTFPGARVLDVETGAGGFALWCLDAGCRVTCAGTGDEFEATLKQLEEKGARTFLMDVFRPDLEALGGPFDLLLWDVAAEPAASLAAMTGFLALLAPGGRSLFVAKDCEPPAGWVAAALPPGWAVEKVLPSKPGEAHELREAYVIIARSPDFEVKAHTQDSEVMAHAQDFEAEHKEDGMEKTSAEVSAVISRALELRDDDEPVEFAVLQACRELHPEERLEWFTRVMGVVTGRARRTGENWKQAAVSLASTPDAGMSTQDVVESKKYHSLKDVPEPLRGDVWKRLHRGRRGAGRKKE